MEGANLSVGAGVRSRPLAAQDQHMRARAAALLVRLVRSSEREAALRRRAREARRAARQQAAERRRGELWRYRRNVVQGNCGNNLFTTRERQSRQLRRGNRLQSRWNSRIDIWVWGMSDAWARFACRGAVTASDTEAPPSSSDDVDTDTSGRNMWCCISWTGMFAQGFFLIWLGLIRWTMRQMH